MGAGTGIVAQLLSNTGASVISVDPDANMLRQLTLRLPDADVRIGSAENLPFSDDFVNVVTMISAWHWVSPEVASAEIARVLRSDGLLVLGWNGPDQTIPWVRSLIQLRNQQGRTSVESIARHDPTAVALPVDAPFRDVGTVQIKWVWTRTAQQILGLFGTYSGVLAGASASLDEVRAEVQKVVLEHGERGALDLPMSLRIFHARRLRR